MRGAWCLRIALISLLLVTTVLFVVPKPKAYKQISKASQAKNEDSEEVPSACIGCSWMNYLDNPSWERIYQKKNFSIDDDYAITVPASDPELECMPELFGYTDEKAKEVFPNLNYKLCSEKVQEPKWALNIDLEKNLLTMNCTGEFPGKYVLGTSSTNETFLLPGGFKNKVQTYSGPVELTDEEWALGTCDPDAIKFEQADYHHRAKPEVIQRAKELMAKQLRSNHLRGFNSFDPNRLSILMLTIDSASRRHFFRKLPKTVAYLNELQSRYSVTDFKIHNVIGDNSAFNQIPLFTGSQMIRKTRREGDEVSYYNGDALNKSLYKYMKEMGYATLMALEFCHPYFIEYLGRKPDFDHLMGNFWCGAHKFSGYHFEKMSSGQRCIGAEFSHSYLLNYLKEFTINYQEVNQFMYAHITTGHEASGRQIQTLDDDLVEFLQDYLEIASSLNIEVAILLQGDHGMRYGAWYTEAAAFQEHRLPAFFMIMTQSLVNRLPNAHDVLMHNSERLVSKLDMHLTVKTLAYAAYTTKLSRHSQSYRWKYNDKKVSSSVSLFTEKIPNTRTCSSIHVPAYWCSCHKMTEVKPDKPYIVRVVNRLLDYALATMNSRTLTPEWTYGYSICQKLTLKEIKAVEVSSLTRQDEAFQIEFSVNEENAMFQVYLVLGKRQVYFRRKKDTQDAYEPAPFHYFGAKLQVRLMFVKRLDSYSGICELLAREVSIDPSLCVCNRPSYLKDTIPLLFLRVAESFEPVVSQEPGLSCEKVCKASNFECSPQYFSLLADCTAVSKVLSPVTSCSQGTHLQARLGEEGYEVTIAQGDCQAEPEQLAVCACTST
mmetsp:Transcript_20175/g.37607  ORF Transcript_20175/g.37607 Transcript_20175/m.37607 type:complete len:828 (-) Transcript_20175:1181-3664(-)